MKIAILVTHLLGTGHLVRAIALARAIKAFGDEPIVLSGGFPTPHLANDTIPFVQLPPVRSNGVDFRTLLTDGGAVANATLWEARKDILAKTLAKYAEDARVAVRAIRRGGMDDLKKAEKAKEISEDELHNHSDAIQKLTDQMIQKIDAQTKTTEGELMRV